MSLINAFLLELSDASTIATKSDDTAVTVANSFKSNVSHYQMMKDIQHQWKNWSADVPAIFITYNGIRFDEEVMRRQFYWNLYDPYFTNTNGNLRLDLFLKMFVIAHFYKKEFPIPLNDSQISLKLEDLANALTIDTSNAHDALADCVQMLELSKLIIKNAAPVWKASIKGSSKNGNLELLQSQPFAMIGEVVRRKRFTYPVTFCGQNPKMNNEVAVADLYFDPDQLNELTDSELLEQIGNSGTAIRKVRINKSLPVMSSDQIPNIDTFLDIPYDQLEERARKIQENVKLQTRVSELLASNQINYPPPKYLEQTVYSGFPSDADDLWMERFHSLPWEERSKLLDGFEDPRYKELAERLICSNSPELASPDMMSRYQNFLNQRLYDKGPWLSLEKSLEKTKKLLSEATGEEKDILERLEKNMSQKNIFN